MPAYRSLGYVHDDDLLVGGEVARRSTKWWVSPRAYFYLGCIHDDDLLVGGEEGSLVNVHREGDNGPAVLRVRFCRQRL